MNLEINRKQGKINWEFLFKHWTVDIKQPNQNPNIHHNCYIAPSHEIRQLKSFRQRVPKFKAMLKRSTTLPTA